MLISDAVVPCFEISVQACRPCKALKGLGKYAPQQLSTHAIPIRRFFGGVGEGEGLKLPSGISFVPICHELRNGTSEGESDGGQGKIQAKDEGQIMAAPMPGWSMRRMMVYHCRYLRPTSDFHPLWSLSTSGIRYHQKIPWAPLWKAAPSCRVAR